MQSHFLVFLSMRCLSLSLSGTCLTISLPPIHFPPCVTGYTNHHLFFLFLIKYVFWALLKIQFHPNTQSNFSFAFVDDIRHQLNNLLNYFSHSFPSIYNWSSQLKFLLFLSLSLTRRGAGWHRCTGLRSVGRYPLQDQIFLSQTHSLLSVTPLHHNMCQWGLLICQTTEVCSWWSVQCLSH